MTSFAITWDATFDTEPADDENINLGAGRVRDLKTAIVERQQVDHLWQDTTEDGKHQKVTLPVSASDPVLDAGNGCVYAKTITGNTELFYEDSAGRVLQLTNAGASNVYQFPSGTRLTFPQAAPPTGWTQVNTWNDVLTRIVDNTGTGGATGGGTWTITGLTADAHDHGFSTPWHQHAVPMSFNGGVIGANQPYGTSSEGTRLFGFIADTGTTTSTAALTKQAVENDVGGTTGGASANSITSAGTWKPPYLNSIVASKN